MQIKYELHSVDNP
jgi:sporulation protein YlmC with PRC-barrel domain